MANNRLYIVDTETGDKFLLCKSFGYDWGVLIPETYPQNRFFRWIQSKSHIIQRIIISYRIDALNTWLCDRDIKTAGNDGDGKNSALKLLTEYEIE